ncbi:MAG: AMP-binding protein, partial [Sciscionella sp.]
MSEYTTVEAQLALTPLMGFRALVSGAQNFLEDARSARTLSYTQLLTEVDCYAKPMGAVAQGGKVLIAVQDPMDFVVAFLGVVAAGRCAVPVDPQAPVAELLRTVALVKPVALVSDRAQRARELDLPQIRPDAHPVEDSHHGGGGSVLLLTSGSTGAPKSVRLEESRLLHVARTVAAHNRLTPADRGYNSLPLFHINA